jgi:S-adenosylmethionine-diacylglycerol 3-amino-3-carboxypropyl transferase
VGLIRKGIFFAGRFERHFRKLAFLLDTFGRKRVQKLLSFEDLEEQRRFVREEWLRPTWQRFLRLLAHEYVFRIFLRDPGFYQYVPKGLDVGEYIVDRMNKSLCQHLVSQNYFMHFILTGRYKVSDGLPPFLQAVRYEGLQAYLRDSEVSLVTCPLEQYLAELPDKCVDKFSTSDISGYMSEREFGELLKLLLRVGAENAVICMRQFMTPRRLPDDFARCYVFDTRLEKELAANDYTFVYDFWVARRRHCEN